MALPKLENPTYTLQLPSTGETIKYRPFLVKEQKVLLLATEGKEQNLKDVVNAIKGLIKGCTFNSINVDEAPLFDIEYIFLKLRAKSVGETAKVSVLCPDDNETRQLVEVNLDNIEPIVDEGHTNMINITDTIKIEMGYPTLSDFEKGFSTDDTDAALELIKTCIGTISEGEKVYNKIDYTEKELDEFVGSFNTEQLGKIMRFFATMPTLKTVVKVTNPKTKVESEVVVQGLQSFLA